MEMTIVPKITYFLQNTNPCSNSVCASYYTVNVVRGCKELARGRSVVRPLDSSLITNERVYMYTSDTVAYYNCGKHTVTGPGPTRSCDLALHTAQR